MPLVQRLVAQDIATPGQVQVDGVVAEDDRDVECGCALALMNVLQKKLDERHHGVALHLEPQGRASERYR